MWRKERKEPSWFGLISLLALEPVGCSDVRVPGSSLQPRGKEPFHQHPLPAPAAPSQPGANAGAEADLRRFGGPLRGASLGDAERVPP